MEAGHVTWEAGGIVVGYVGTGSFAGGAGGASVRVVTGVIDKEEKEKVVYVSP